jgi:hypothetical protein
MLNMKHAISFLPLKGGGREREAASGWGSIPRPETI